MDEDSIKSQIGNLFDKFDKMNERVLKMEVRQEALLEGHDEHKDKINKNSDLLTKISIGGIVLFMAAEQLGLLDKIL